MPSGLNKYSMHIELSHATTHIQICQLLLWVLERSASVSWPTGRQIFQKKGMKGELKGNKRAASIGLNEKDNRKKNLPLGWFVDLFKAAVVRSLESIWKWPIFRVSPCSQCQAGLPFKCQSPWMASEDSSSSLPPGSHLVGLGGPIVSFVLRLSPCSWSPKTGIVSRTEMRFWDNECKPGMLPTEQDGDPSTTSTPSQSWFSSDHRCISHQLTHNHISSTQIRT